MPETDPKDATALNAQIEHPTRKAVAVVLNDLF